MLERRRLRPKINGILKIILKNVKAFGVVFLFLFEYIYLEIKLYVRSCI